MGNAAEVGAISSFLTRLSNVPDERVIYLAESRPAKSVSSFVKRVMRVEGPGERTRRENEGGDEAEVESSRVESFEVDLAVALERASLGVQKQEEMRAEGCERNRGRAQIKMDDAA